MKAYDNNLQNKIMIFLGVCMMVMMAIFIVIDYVYAMFLDHNRDRINLHTAYTLLISSAVLIIINLKTIEDQRRKSAAKSRSGNQ